MIATLRSAVYEALKKEEETFNMYTRFSNESKDQVLKDFFKSLAHDTQTDINTIKHLNLHSIIKFGLTIKFQVSKLQIDERTAKNIKDVAGAKDILKITIDKINADIEYYNHISEQSIFPEVKRLFHIVRDKKLEDKRKIKALMDFMEL